MEQTEDDIVVTRSSDPREVGLSTKKMTYWYQAFKQLFENIRLPSLKGRNWIILVRWFRVLDFQSIGY